MFEAPSRRRELEPGVILKLAIRLVSLAPPKLSYIIVQIKEAGNLTEFIKIIREFLPEREADIMSTTSMTQQIASFCSYFEDRYFPLQEMFKDFEYNEIESYGELVQGVPIIDNLGFDYEQYHEIPENYRDSIKLITFLVECPFEGDEGARLVLGEACAKLVPIKLLKMVPEGGFCRESLHKYLDKTPYEGVVTWVDMMWVDTGNYFFDLELTRCGCGMGYIPRPDWTREVVDDLTQEWKRAEKIMNDFEVFKKWLEAKPKDRFKEILDFILEKEKQANGKVELSGKAELERKGSGLQMEVTETAE